MLGCWHVLARDCIKYANGRFLDPIQALHFFLDLFHYVVRKHGVALGAGKTPHGA
jgi:hypothetical protein